MRVLNIHERSFPVASERVGSLLDRLATRDDPIWPHELWPRMRLDRPLAPGAAGGHGPIRYVVEAHDPGRRVVFRFTAPKGFEGTHEFDVIAHPSGAALRHTISMEAGALASVSWPVVYRPLHDALIEDALAKAGRTLGVASAAPGWPLSVRLLRRALRLLGHGSRERPRSRSS